MIAAPASGSGKTTLTAAILRALSRQGHEVRPFKCGPDYIDPQFHSIAAGVPCLNLDAWAMPPAILQHHLSGPAGPRVIEAAMGLFDGAGLMGKGSAADLAAQTQSRIVLVVDCSKASHSIAAVVKGMVTFDPRLSFVGLILNNVGSPRHEAMLRHALHDAPPVLGAVHRTNALTLPSRHLGLVQFIEHLEQEAWLDRAADIVSTALDLSVFETSCPASKPASGATPPGQRIAVAQDEAFAFCYTHHLKDWRAAGAEVLPFSPLADDPVPKGADYVYLPGGYPELYAGQLAAASRFKESLKHVSQHIPIYGECGGYMTLGEHLIDADGIGHEMTGLLPLDTSFQHRKLHLGYRLLPGPLPMSAHEFHYATTIKAKGTPVFHPLDADGNARPPQGLRQGHVYGSFLHIIGDAPHLAIDAPQPTA